MYKWIIGLLILAAILFGYAWYKADQLARVVDCMYILIDMQQVNEEACK